MLTDFTGADRVYIACGYTDLLRGIDGLAALVHQQLSLDPFANTLISLVRQTPRQNNGVILVRQRIRSAVSLKSV